MLVAIEKAREVLSNNNLLELPINVNKIAEYLGIMIEEVDLGNDISGVLVLENGDARICVNERQIIVRKRFTIAHEIGHFQLHTENLQNKLFVDNAKVMYRRSSISPREKKQEREANVFAANLLMPKALILDEYQNLIENDSSLSDDDIVSKLAEKFEVSVPAMSIRLVNLNCINPF